MTTKLVGGKAASLYRLKEMGCLVPDFIVVSAGDDIDLDQIDKLNGELFAVRSSANVEDGNLQSFAGQFQTFLNTPRSDVLSKVQECRESYKSERVKAYCQANGVKIEDIRVSVIIQEMVQAQTSGVCFTKHPVTGSDDMVIEAVFGLGEALVSGEVTPDTYIIDRKGLKVRQVHIEGSEQKLSAIDIEKVAAEALRIEQHFHRAVDIEWLIKANNLYILQARPITA